MSEAFLYGANTVEVSKRRFSLVGVCVCVCVRLKPIIIFFIINLCEFVKFEQCGLYETLDVFYAIFTLRTRV